MATPDSTPTPVAKPQTWWEYLIHAWPFHLRVLVFGGVLLAAWIGFNYVRDMRAELEAQKKVTATLAAKQTTLGDGSIQTGNQTGTQAQVNQQAQQAFGPDVTELMKQQNAQILALAQAVGNINGAITQIKNQTPDKNNFNPTQQTATGGIVNYPFEESRTSGPGLSAFHLNYDPTKRDPNTAFQGSYWQHYGEQFNISVGEWEKKKDGGMRTAIKLTRTVTKPDPNDSTKTITVGTENIPLGDAETTYTPPALVPAPKNPRWTANLGISSSSVTSPTASGSKYSAFGTRDYRLTDKYGIFAGLAGGGPAVGVSIRLDAGKK